MREYTKYKSFIPKVEKLMETDDLVYNLSNWLTLTSLGVPEEIAEKIVHMDISYMYTKLMNGKEMLSTKESYFRLKRFKCFKQEQDDLYFAPNKHVREILAPQIDVENPTGYEIVISEVEKMEKIIKEISLNKLQLDDEKKVRMMKDILTNFRLLLKKMGMTEKKEGNVATLSKDGISITINAQGITDNNVDMISINSGDAEIKLK